MTDNQNVFSWEAVSNYLQMCKKPAVRHLSAQQCCRVDGIFFRGQSLQTITFNCQTRCRRLQISHLKCHCISLMCLLCSFRKWRKACIRNRNL